MRRQRRVGAPGGMRTLATRSSGDLDAQSANDSPLLVSLLDGTGRLLPARRANRCGASRPAGRWCRARVPRRARGTSEDRRCDRRGGAAAEARRARGGVPGVDGTARSPKSPNADSGGGAKAVVARLPVTARQLVVAVHDPRRRARAGRARASSSRSTPARRCCTRSPPGVVMHAPPRARTGRRTSTSSRWTPPPPRTHLPRAPGRRLRGAHGYRVRSVDAKTGASSGT